jgi:phosphatidylinositol alpha-mannosyltransferase
MPTAANGSIAPLAPDASAALRTLRVLDDERFDVVHLHEPLAPGPTLTAVLTHSAPTVGTFHAAGVSASYRLFKPVLRRWIDRIDHKVVVSKDALLLAQSHLGGDYEILFNGVEVEEIRAIEPFGTDTARPTVFFCGRHEERKGLRVLVEAFAGLDLDGELWIGSDGPDEEKFARLRRADVFCAPSLGGESFGVVLIEAMAAGTTVVASSIAGYQNVATDGEDALLPPPGDVRALRDALRLVLSDPAEAARLRTAGDRRAEEFDMRSLADEYLRIYHRLLEG